jgi:carbon starvation protein CstA
MYDKLTHKRNRKMRPNSARLCNLFGAKNHAVAAVALVLAAFGLFEVPSNHAVAAVPLILATFGVLSGHLTPLRASSNHAVAAVALILATSGAHFGNF